MSETIIYFLILALIFFVCIATKTKTIYWGSRIVSNKGFIGKYILAEYVVIAFFSVVCLKLGLVEENNIRLWPYLLMLFSIIIMISPFLDEEPLSIDLTQVEYSNIFSVITFIYLIATIFVTVMLWNSIQTLLISQTWNANRVLGYTGMDEVIYKNSFEWLSINIVNYLKIIVMVIMMYYFVNGIHRVRGLLLFIATFLNTIMVSMYSSSRGTIFNYMLLLILMYLLYRAKFETRIKKVVDKVLIILGVTALVYALAVTTSRFGDTGSNSSRDSLLFYFGHAPLVFNQNVSTITGYGYGRFSLYGLLNLLSVNVNLSQEAIGGSWGKQFYTYIGTWYIDFGFLGVVVLSIFFSTIIKRIIRNGTPLLSTCFAVFFAASFLIEGAFVIGRFYCLTFIVNIAIFGVLRFLETRVRWS